MQCNAMYADGSIHHQCFGWDVQAVAGIRLDHVDAVEMRRRTAAGYQELRGHVAAAIRPLATEVQDDDLAAGVRRHPIRRGLAQCSEDAGGDPLYRRGSTTGGRGLARIDQAALGKM